MSNYERSNEGPGGISSLPATIGSPARPYAPQVPQYPAAPVYSAMPQYPAFPAFPKRTGVLRGLAGLFGLGTEGTSFWSQPWFPYAALGALGVGIYWLVKSKGGSVTMNPFLDVGIGDLEAGPSYDYLMGVVNEVRRHPTEETYLEAWNIIGDTVAAGDDGAEAAYTAGKALAKFSMAHPDLKHLLPPEKALIKLIPFLTETGRIESIPEKYLVPHKAVKIRDTRKHR